MKYLLLLTLFIHSLWGFTNFVTAEEAFKPSVELNNGKLEAKIVLAEGIYVYKDKISLSFKEQGVTFNNLKYTPQAIDHGGSLVFTSTPTLTADIIKKDEKLKEVTILFSYQGCSSHGLCYEPQTKEFKINIENIADKKLQEESQKSVSESDMITDTFKSGNISLILLTFFGFGLLLSMTPCVFPMIPILSSIIVSQGEGMNAKKGFMLSLVYVLAMSVAYTMAGVFAGLFGANIQASLQNPWVLSIFAGVFVLLAISMFGFFEIGLPSSIQSRLSNSSTKAGDKGGFAGVAVMGFLSALIVGPCVAPPLAGALVYIGQTGDALLGGVALFVMSLGMGMPLLLIGIGAGKFMPRPGGWMSSVSKVFGVIMLMIAIWMLSRILPETIVMLLWAMLLMVSSVYLGAFETLGGKHSWNALNKGFGLIIFTLGLSLLLGLISGSTKLLDPFEQFKSQGLVQSSVTSASELEFITIKSSQELDTLLEKNKGKKIMLDFYADWCTSCKELEHNTFSDATVQKKLSEYLLIQANITDNSAEEKALAKRFQLFGPPAILFFDEDSQEQKAKRIIGYKNAQEFADLIP